MIPKFLSGCEPRAHRSGSNFLPEVGPGGHRFESESPADGTLRSSVVLSPSPGRSPSIPQACIGGRTVCDAGYCCDDHRSTRGGANRQLRAGLISSDALVTETVHGLVAQALRQDSQWFFAADRYQNLCFSQMSGSNTTPMAWKVCPKASVQAGLGACLSGRCITGKLKKAPIGKSQRAKCIAGVAT